MPELNNESSTCCQRQYYVHNGERVDWWQGWAPLAWTFLFLLSSSLSSPRAQYVGLKVNSLGELGRQKGWHSFKSAAPRLRKKASEAYIWKKISGIWLAQILVRPVLACKQPPSQVRSRCRVSLDCCSRVFRMRCSLSWNWPMNYRGKV